MRLKILIPTEVVLDEEATGIVAEGADGSFGLRPRHVDFVSALVPGLIYVENADKGTEEYVAVDRGILVKNGPDVYVSVRNAARSASLENLLRVVRTQFGVLDEHERILRSAVARLESHFVRRFMDLA